MINFVSFVKIKLSFPPINYHMMTISTNELPTSDYTPTELSFHYQNLLPSIKTLKSDDQLYCS
jgi:hypothetical protein